jgi:flavin reductase (DIM6/NTAB) family NADH-FMN oxidoreductase RutF
VVYGEVVRIHVKDEVLTPQGKLDYSQIKPLARMGYYDYTAVSETFEMRIPNASGAAADGLEGKA